MSISTNPTYRAAAIGVVSAALLVGAFTIGASRSSPAAASQGSANQGQGSASQSHGATLTAASGPGARITVTGVGTVTGTPNQLLLSMGVSVNGASVSSALGQSNQTVRNVTAALRNGGVAARDIQTSGLSIYPNYQGNSQVPVSYQVSESLTATLNNLAKAGSQIQAAVHAGGNAVTVDNVSLNLTDTGKLLAAARAAAVQDARAKAAQFAAALGEPLGPVVSITPEQQISPVYYGLNGDAAASAKAATVPISPGKQQVSISITVIYAA
jgi:hypothetical protein